MNLIYQVFSDMNIVEARWREFECRANCTVFQSFDWLSEWYRHIGSKTNSVPIIVLILNMDEIISILPLTVERRRMVDRLTWLGSELCDYNAPMLSPKFCDFVKPGQFVEVWREIIQIIRTVKHFDVIELEKMPDVVDSQPNPFSELPVLIANYSGHVATLVDSWDKFYTTKISKSHRQTDRRKFRNLEKCGEVQFVTVQDDVVPTLNLLIKEKRASYARMRVSDVFSRPGYLAFYQSIVTNPKMRDIVHITRIDVGGIPVATGIGLVFKCCYSLVMSSYEYDYARHSPGRLHIHNMLQYAIDRKIKYFDFTIGDELYKYDWSDIELKLLSYYKSNTLIGRILVMANIVAHNAILWYNQIPPLKRLVGKTRRAVNQIVKRRVF